MNKKILFLDMDGTTLDDKGQMSRENIRALEKVIQAGHEVVIATGRITSSARLLLTTYGLDKIGCRYLISYNGGMIYDCEKDEVLFKKTLPLSMVRELILKAREAGVYIQTYENNDNVNDYVLSERDDENLANYIKKNSVQKKVVPDLAEALQEEPCKLLVIDVHRRGILEKFCTEMGAWAQGKVDMYLSCTEYMEIVPKGICKGNALKAFCELTGTPVQNTIAAGDENNDLSMIQKAGIGCAVANAVDIVKAAADYVTKRDNNHSAIAEIAEKFMLNEV